MLSILTLLESKGGPQFVIQKHDAIKSGTHYDIRIEKDGVYKSWATKKLTNLIFNTSQKIAVFMQPDHDLSWGDFEGEISEPNYGAGKVSKYDYGYCTILSWDDSKILVNFNGQKIKGTFAFIKYPGKDNNETQWLLLKTNKH
jgi:bifunctional non-homologous end joining protein LigD